MRANARRSSPQIGVRLRVTHLTLIRSRGKLKMVPNDNPSAAPRARFFGRITRWRSSPW